jgi:hypothetical protein
MSSFVQDNLDRFQRIQGDYNNIANSIGRLTNSGNKEDDLKSKLELAGSGIESGANLYMEGRRMVHELHSRKLGKDLISELKAQGQRNIDQLKSNNQSLSAQLKRSRPRSVRSSPGGGDQGSSGRRDTGVSEEEVKAPEISPEQLRSDIQASQARLERLQQPQRVDTDVSAQQSEQPLTLEQISRGEFPERPTPAPQPAEAPPTEMPQPTGDLGRNVAVEQERQDPYIGAKTVSQNAGQDVNQARVAPDDAGAPAKPSAGTARAAEQGADDMEDAASSAAKTAATTAAEVGTEEAAGSALDSIPGLDILGLALNAIGGITAAVGSGLPEKKPEAPEPPKPVSIGGNFAPSVVEAGGTTA